MSAARVLAASLLAAASLACEPSAETSTHSDAGVKVGEGGAVARFNAATGTGTDKGGECAACHMEEYEHVRQPPHVGVRPTTCGVCHVQSDWRPDVVQHDFWPLAGAHKGRPDTQCSWCHKGTPWVFKGTPKACVGCHKEDYDASTFPDHQTFPTKCANCHSTEAWKPAKHPLPPPPPPAPTPTPTPSTKGTPKGTPPRSPPRTTPTATVPSTSVPIPRPTSVPTTRPPDVISRPSRR